jgi:hypothetical protein
LRVRSTGSGHLRPRKSNVFSAMVKYSEVAKIVADPYHKGCCSR